MAFFREGLLVIISTLLFLVVILGGILYVLSVSLEYDNIKIELKSFAKNLTNNTFNLIEPNFNITAEMQRARITMEKKCLNEISYNFSSGGYTFVLPCNLVKNNESIDLFIDHGTESIIYQVYYANYSCKFLECFKKNRYPLFLVSEKAQDYWEKKFYFSLLIFVILFILTFLLVEIKYNSLIITGSAFVVSSVIVSKVEQFFEFLFKNQVQLIKIFFSQTKDVYIILLILGLVLIVVGLSLRIFLRDKIKEKFSKKDIREMIREEITKEKTRFDGIKADEKIKKTKNLLKK